MKKILVFLALVIALLVNYNASAKDTISNDTKYYEDTYKFIINGYDKESKKDGHLVGGTFIKTKDNKKYEEILIVKYNENGKIEWDYINETEGTENSLYSINYYYEESKITGYIINLKEDQTAYFVKLDLDGNLIEKAPQSNCQTTISMKEVVLNNTFQGYITAGTINIDGKNIGIITKYNELLEPEWTKQYNMEEYNELSVIDIIPITNNEYITGYNFLLELTQDNVRTIKYLKINEIGEDINTIKENFEENDYPSIYKTDSGYILYGYTHEVKVNNNKSQSYYLIKYNDNDEVEWETIGNIEINPKKPLKLEYLKENNEDKYYVMATNSTDEALEITKIAHDGTIENKIKKINNSYYDIKTFILDNNTIYFIGQINCPEYDKCTYERKSLYLISDEDKVIEVQDNDSKLILIITLVLIVGVCSIVIIRRNIKKDER